jgi:hypothetical protein
MKILDASVEWYNDYANNPVMRVVVDKIPELKYNKYGNMYFGENEGYVDFLLETNDKTGFGGRTFNLKMEDGSEVAVKGPWSSRASVCNCMGLTPCNEVYIQEQGKYSHCGNLTVPKLLEAAKLANVYLIMSVSEYNHSPDSWHSPRTPEEDLEFLVTEDNWRDLTSQWVKSREFRFNPSVNPTQMEKFDA